MSEQHTQCAKPVFTGTFGGSQCLNKGKVEHAGKWWCHLHSPEGKKKREDATQARWDAAAEQQHKREDKRREERRRAECYPDLLKALKAALATMERSYWEGNTHDSGLDSSAFGPTGSVAQARTAIAAAEAQS